MKKLWFWLIMITGFLLCGCSKEPVKTEYSIPENTAKHRMVLATDLHYLSPELTDHGSLTMRLVESGDGKLIQYSPEIVDAFLDEMQTMKPELLLLSGDLTFNGEKKSHEGLAEKLTVLQESGIKILVIPGNHDLSNPYSRGYSKDKFYGTPSIDEHEFIDIYQSFGYDNALSRDENSLSYIYPLDSDLWLLMIDVNTEPLLGSITQKSLAWMEEQLQEAQEKNITVISVSHQNVLSHNEMFQDGYVINCNRNIGNLFHEYGVKLNLSGHMHLQHIANTEKGVYDIATSSLAVSPNQYGIIDLDQQHNITYQTKQTEVSVWANKNSKKDSNLKDFADYSKKMFHKITYNKTINHLKDLNLTESEKKEVCELIIGINYDYFAGTLYDKVDFYKNSDAYALLQKNSDENRFLNYINFSLDEAVKNENQVYIPK